MSKDWFQDMVEFDQHYGFDSVVETWDSQKLKEWLKFRFRFLQEEKDEGNDAVDSNDPEEIVDALIDLIVVATGTLSMAKVDAHEAWDRVLKSNMSKVVGIKEGRPNPLGLPDLTKPEGWEAPNHSGNHGLFSNLNK